MEVNTADTVGALNAQSPTPQLPRAIWELALGRWELSGVVVVRAVLDQVEIAILAARRFLDLAVGQPERLRPFLPGLDQNRRIVGDGFVLNRVAHPAEAFDDLQ